MPRAKQPARRASRRTKAARYAAKSKTASTAVKSPPKVVIPVPETHALLPDEHEAARRILNNADGDAVSAAWRVFVCYLQDAIGSELDAFRETVKNLGDPKPIEHQLAASELYVTVHPIADTITIGIEIRCSKYAKLTAQFDADLQTFISRGWEFSEHAALENGDRQDISRAMYCALFFPGADPVYYKEAFQALQDQCTCGADACMDKDHWNEERWRGARFTFGRRTGYALVLEPGDRADSTGRIVASVLERYVPAAVSAAIRTPLPDEHEAVRRILNDDMAVLGWGMIVRHLTHTIPKELNALIETVKNLGSPTPITHHRLSDAAQVTVFPLPGTTNIGVQIQCSKYCIMTATFAWNLVELISRNTEFSEYTDTESASPTISRAMYCALFLPNADPAYYEEAFQAQAERCECDEHWADEQWRGCRLSFNRTHGLVTITERGDNAARVVYSNGAQPPNLNKNTK